MSDLQRRILIVDDEPLLLRSMGRNLRRSYRVCLAAGPEEGLATLARDHDFDLVISDLKMPTMDGVSFLREVRARYPDLSHKLVLMSGAMVWANEVVAAIEGFGIWLISKPCSLEDIGAAFSR